LKNDNAKIVKVLYILGIILVIIVGLGLIIDGLVKGNRPEFSRYFANHFRTYRDQDLLRDYNLFFKISDTLQQVRDKP